MSVGKPEMDRNFEGLLALEALVKFGGSSIEEVLEKGFVSVTPL